MANTRGIRSDFDICPYCNEPMQLRYVIENDRSNNSYETNYSRYQGYIGVTSTLRTTSIGPRVLYICPVCKAQSPSITLTTKMINLDHLKASMADLLDEIDEESEELDND